MFDWRIEPASHIQGEVTIPSDKSITHRAMILAALSEGKSILHSPCVGEDCVSTIELLKNLGVTYAFKKDAMVINGVGLHGLVPSTEPLYVGNSGTTLRLMMGVLAGQPFQNILYGDASLNRRPMERAVIPLRIMGAKISTDAGHAPVSMLGQSPLKGMTYEMPLASAQVKSAILFAGLFSNEPIEIVCQPCRDHTERLFKLLGLEIKQFGRQIYLKPGKRKIAPFSLTVPSDFSSAAFFILAAVMTPGSHIHLRHINVNPTRTGFLKILRAMGADIHIGPVRLQDGEPIADIDVTSQNLCGITVPPAWVPSCIDELPLVMVAAAVADGETLIRGAQELRFKESDRIAAMAQGLTNLGIKTKTYEDGILIQGGQLKSGYVHSAGDHRIAMAFSVAGLAAKGPIIVQDCKNVATSFPGFIDELRAIV